MAGIVNFLNSLSLYGLEYFNKYYGVYMAQVVRNDDPAGRGRVQAYCPEAGQQSPGPEVWILPAFSGAGRDRGSFFPPEVGDSVWVSFAQGNPGKPQTYWGGWFGKSDVPAEFAYDDDIPQRRGMITRGGHRMVFVDTPGEERVEISWHKPSSSPDDRKDTPSRDGQTATLRFTSDGVVLQVKDQSTQIVIEDGKIKIDGAQVEIATGADSPAVRGNEWFQWAASHTHGTAWGPSTTPVPAPPSNILSKNTKVK